MRISLRNQIYQKICIFDILRHLYGYATERIPKEIALQNIQKFYIIYRLKQGVVFRINDNGMLQIHFFELEVF